MGGVMHAWEEEQSQGYKRITDQWICRSCVKDQDLLKSLDGKPGKCSYCKRTRSVVLDVEVIQERIMNAVFEEYGPVQNSDAPWDGEEGRFMVPSTDAGDIIWELLGDTLPEGLIEDLTEAILDPDWCERDWAILSPYERFKHGWSTFCHTVMHQNRFTFAFKPEEDPGHPDSTSPGMTLFEIGNLMQGHGLVRKIEIGQKLFRVRVDESMKSYGKYDDLASPPFTAARTNRMSPAGIPMFYGSPHRETAIVETWDGKKPCMATIAKFVTSQPIWILDLVDIPPVPGRFSGADRGLRAALRFLHDLAKDASKPVTRDGHEHVEYVPTQIVSEYLLTTHKFQSPEDGSQIQIAGIRFGSSRNNTPNWVLNFKHPSHDVHSRFSDALMATDFLTLVKVNSKLLRNPG